MTAGKTQSEIELANKEIRGYGGPWDKNEIRRALVGLEFLGIAGLLFLMEKIKAGESIFISMVSRLPDEKFPGNATPAEGVSWWKKNRLTGQSLFPKFQRSDAPKPRREIRLIPCGRF